VHSIGWLRGTVVERRSLTGELLLSFARPAADGSPLMWVNRSQRRRPPGLLGQKERPHHPHCSGTFTGCASRSASSSGYVCWSTGVCTAWHRRTSPTTSSRLLLLVPAVNSGPLTLRLWWSGPPDARRPRISRGSCTRLEQPPASC